MKKHVELIDNCTGCTACYSICPNNAISMERDKYGFVYPKISLDKCIDCELCKKVCPTKEDLGYDNRKAAWYGWHKDKKIILDSSSGGAFTALAQKVLDFKGKVYSAVINYQTKDVEIIETDNLSILRRSKYVDSYLNQSLKNVKKDLDDGIMVLFCATPCQVAGLLSYLGKEYENLITCDFLCHGVSSSKILKEHLAFLEAKNQSPIKKINFRPKTLGWKKHAIKVDFNNNSVYSKSWNNDSYFYGDIVTELFLKNSCYDCKYRFSHVSDVTLGDFWGVFEYRSELQNADGISLIVTNSQKGMDFITNNKFDFDFNELELKYTDYAFYKLNSKLAKNKIDEKNKFMNLVDKIGFEKAAKKVYMKNRFVRYFLLFMQKIRGFKK